jgi:hypothetical protein
MNVEVELKLCWMILLEENCESVVALALAWFF